MNCSPSARAAPLHTRASTSAAPGHHHRLLVRMCTSTSTFSMRKRPDPELLLPDLPEPGEAVWLDDEEDDDQRTEADQLQLAQEPRLHIPAHHCVEGPVQEQREESDERRAEERAHHRTQATDDDHEEDLERALQIERLRLDRAQVGERPERAGDPA